MRDYEFYYTQDGSIGLYSYADHDVYHSKFGALSEAWEKFVLPTDLEHKLVSEENINILDICYGIGYNTKALMSNVINLKENNLKKENFLKLFCKKFLKKIINKIDNHDTIDSNNLGENNRELSPSNETICKKITIDCLDINEELIKISPLLKTVITPQEIYTKIVPKIFDCFELYWKIKKFIANKMHIFFPLLMPKNRAEIIELLDLKYKNNYDRIKNEYRINTLVNYIIIDALINKYKDDYLNMNLKKIIKEKKMKGFFDPSLIKYAKYKQDFRYNFISRFNLASFLHNIYYDHLSKRYKKIKSNNYSSLFKLNFHVNDARKSILELNTVYNVIFLDAFTYSKAPQLWTVEFIAELYKRLASTGILITYSNSALIRNTLLKNGFYVGKIYDKNSNKYIGTIAAKDKSLIKHPLSNYELGLCSTKAGIPYHDENLNLPNDVIIKRTEAEFKSSSLMSSSRYLKSRRRTSE